MNSSEDNSYLGVNINTLVQCHTAFTHLSFYIVSFSIMQATLNEQHYQSVHSSYTY
jgi:hypothetical protein